MAIEIKGGRSTQALTPVVELEKPLRSCQLNQLELLFPAPGGGFFHQLLASPCSAMLKGGRCGHRVLTTAVLQFS